MKIILTLTTISLVMVMGLFIINQPTTIDSDLVANLAGASQAYQDGNYAEAVQSYQQVIEMGVVNSDLYYNVGNAYFKQGNLGQAILNYKRALRLNPRDADIQTNLALAQEQTKDQLDTSGESIINQLAEISETWLTQDELALLVVMLWVGLVSLIMAYLFSQSSRTQELLLYGVSVVGFLVIFSGLILSARFYVNYTNPAGVIIADTVDVSSGPSNQSLTEFTLHAGTMIRLLELGDEWVRITLPGNELQGWVSADTVAFIDEH